MKYEVECIKSAKVIVEADSEKDARMAVAYMENEDIERHREYGWVIKNTRRIQKHEV